VEWVGQFYQYLLFAAVIFASAVAGFGIRHLITRYITNKISVDFARIIARRLGSALVIWSILAGLGLGLKVLTLPATLARYVDQAVFIATVLSATLVIAYIFADMLKAWGTKLGPQVTSITSLGQFFVRLIVLVIGLMIILATLGIEITPMLASLGIGALAVALALQPTLANLFAGLYIMADKPVRVGDFIRLETGQEGYVTDIGWRSIKVCMLPNNTVIIPNQRLAESVVLNYYYPEEKMALLLEVKVSYEDDPVKVEKILVEEMVKASFEIDGMVTAYEMRPFVRFIPGYQDFSLNFTLICQVREVVDQFYVQHELRKRIWDRLKKEGVTVPFPIRTLHLPHKYIKDLSEFELLKAQVIKDERVGL